MRRGSATTPLLGLRVRNPPGDSYVCCDFCVLSGRGLCVGVFTVQRSPTECGMSECDREALIMSRPWPNRCCYAMEKKNVLFYFLNSFRFSVWIYISIPSLSVMIFIPYFVDASV